MLLSAGRAFGRQARIQLERKRSGSSPSSEASEFGTLPARRSMERAIEGRREITVRRVHRLGAARVAGAKPKLSASAESVKKTR
jgi:hypothetical protein